MKLLIITQKVDTQDQLLGFFIDWLRGFAGVFEKVTVLCLEEGHHSTIPGLEVVSLGKDRGQSKLRWLWNFYHYSVTHGDDYDAVFVHMNPIWVVLGGWLWRLMSKRVFLWYAHKQVTWKLRLAEKLAHGVFSSTPEGFRLPSAKAIIVGQGINTDIFRPLNPDSEGQDGRSHRGLRLLSIGRIAKVKNYETLIGAAELLKRRGVDFVVTVIGSPALPQDYEYENTLKMMIHERGLADHFIFLGKIAHADLPAYYQSHDIFVNLAKTGSLDKTIVEAIASGEIVVSSNDAARTILPSKYLVANDDASDLADRLMDLKGAHLEPEVRERVIRDHSLRQLIAKIHDAMSAQTHTPTSVLITGYPYIRESYRNTFTEYPSPEHAYFALPEVWTIKKGKVVYEAPTADNIFKTSAYFHHSDYPIIGGLLKGWMPFLPFVLMKSQIRREVGVLYSASEPILLTTLYNGLCAKIFGLKHVIFSWENISFEEKLTGIKGLIHRIILRLNLALSDGVVCGNQKCQAIFGQLTKKPLAVIPLSGVDADFYKPGTSDFRTKYHLEDKMLFTFAGALSYRKGIHVILDAFGSVIRQVPNAHLVIAGSGEYEVEMKFQIERLGLANSITMIPWLNRDALRDLLVASDVFLYPSISHGGWEEQFGYSMAEASLCGVPVIAARTGSIDEVVIDGTTGILVEPSNALALSQAMVRLGSDADLRLRLGNAGRTYIKDTYSYPIIAKKFYNFFRQIADGDSSSQINNASIKKPRPVIYVTNVRLPTHKAHGLQIMKSCEALASQGASVRLIAPTLRPSVNEDPFAYYGVKPIFQIKKVFVWEVLPFEARLGRWVGYIQNFSFSMSALLYLWWHDLIHEGVELYSRDYMTLWLFCFFGLEPIAELHDYRSTEPKKRIDFVLKRASKIVLNSEGTRALLKEHYELDDSKILVIPNGVDLNYFHVDENQKQAREKLGMAPDQKVVAYIGRLESAGFGKGIPDLIKAFATIAPYTMGVELYIIGGPDDLVGQYKELAREVGITQRVVFTGQVNYRDIPMYLRAVDIVVIPSPQNQHSQTTSPIKLFESMAAGKMIIASDLSAIRPYLNDTNAVLFKSGNVQSLADAISKTLSDIPAGQKRAEQALVDVQQLTWQARAQKILQFLNT